MALLQRGRPNMYKCGGYVNMGASGHTATPTEVVEGYWFIGAFPATGSITLTMPSATSLAAELRSSGLEIGDSIILYYVNTVNYNSGAWTSYNSVSFACGTGGTPIGRNSIYYCSGATIAIRFTSVVSGAETYDMFISCHGIPHI
jgi:hypothetical protein